MTLGEKIKQLRITKGLSQEDLGKLIGVQRAAINKYEKGVVVNLKREVISKLAAALDTSPIYLMGWEDAPGSLPPGVLPLPDRRSFPLVGDIACGTPVLAQENITEYVEFPDVLDADFCLRCRGDSMVDARILDGDIVFVRQQPEVENGEIAVVLIDEETTLKRVYHSGDTLTLMPANPAYAPLIYTGPQLEQVRILGKAVSFLSPAK